MAVQPPNKSKSLTIGETEYHYPRCSNEVMAQWLCLAKRGDEGEEDPIYVFILELCRKVHSLVPCMALQSLPHFTVIQPYINEYARAVTVDNEFAFDYVTNDHPFAAVAQAIRSIVSILDRKTRRRRASNEFAELETPAWCAYVKDGDEGERVRKKLVLTHAIIVYIKDCLRKKRGSVVDYHAQARAAFKISHPNAVLANSTNGDGNGATDSIDEANQSGSNETSNDESDMPRARFRMVDATNGYADVCPYRSTFPTQDYDTFYNVVRDTLRLQHCNISITFLVRQYGIEAPVLIGEDDGDKLRAIFQAPADDMPTFLVRHDG